MSTIRILIVTDDNGGFQRSNRREHQFHVGEFVKVLTDTTWEGFDIAITKAHRNANPQPNTSPDSHPIGADLYDFRFTAASLSGFDMVFFFSIATKMEDPVTSDAARKVEAAAIAAFMETGGGFFATGDHEDLGASICQHIPRVRSMRRWGYQHMGEDPIPHGGSVAPSGIHADRHDTLRPGSDFAPYNGMNYSFQFNDQSDAEPQPIDAQLVYSTHLAGGLVLYFPHPLLSTPLGLMDVLPDHMHEGWCEVPGDLSREEELPGRSGKKEYPLRKPLPLSQQVKPEVIAEATVLAHKTLNQGFDDLTLSEATTSKRFGVIAAYDGHLAGIGRVVVDATWHHFVNINLIGTSNAFIAPNSVKSKGFYSGPGNTPTPAYEKIMWYYRNLVYWLIPAPHSRLIWLKQFAQALHLNPRWEEFQGGRLRSAVARDLQLRYIIGLAKLAEEYFNKVRGHCATYHLLPEILSPLWEFDPHIWEELAPEIAPWHPETPVLSGKIQALPPWRQAWLPDARLRWYMLLGSLAMAVSEHVGLYDEVSGPQFQAVQQRTLELLPHHLELAAEEFESSMRVVDQLRVNLKNLASAASKARTRTQKMA